MDHHPHDHRRHDQHQHEPVDHESLDSEIVDSDHSGHPGHEAATQSAGRDTDGSVPTALPVVRQPVGYPEGLLIVVDDDQQTDHGGKSVPPVTTSGLPYRYKVRLNGSNAYAMTADDLLSLFVPDYPPATPAAAATPSRHDLELERVRSRGRHCLGVMVDHVAKAMLSGSLTPLEEQLLQRSAELDETGPITTAHCERWTHPEVPMLLMGDLYAREYDRYTPPSGNVVFLFPGTAERYLAGLAELGLLTLSENPAWASAPLVEVASR